MTGRSPKESGPDRWELWFPRLIQVVGLAIACYETVIEQHERPWVLLVAVAMMLGGQGLRLLLKGVRGLTEAVSDE